MLHSKFLTDNQGHLIRVFHGTATRFDQFLPLSHFTTDMNKACSYAVSKRLQLEYNKGSIDLIPLIKVMSCSVQSFQEPTQKIVIPAYLKMRHPFKTPTKNVPDGWGKGSIYAYLLALGQISTSLQGYSNPYVDFVFKNPFERTDVQVIQELKLDNLYPITPDMEINRSHLVKQRLIQFWESFGYDGFEYDLTGKNCPAYVVFRPCQVYRLDKTDCNLKPTENFPEYKTKLESIRDAYFRHYKPCKIDISEQIERQGALYIYREVSSKFRDF